MSSIKLFENKKIRTEWNKENNRWVFSVADVVAILTDSKDVRQYIKRMRNRDTALNANWGTICTPVEMIARDGKRRKIQTADAEGLFRIIQSIPSPRAEPFKRWLAKVGYERLEEIENPELAMDRMKIIYEKKGYPKDWIEKRSRGIAIRQELTDEWKIRGAQEGTEYAVLTNEIMRGTFDMNVSQYKKLKELDKENLRDHMTDMELILTMLGEVTTTQLTRKRDSKRFPELQKDAKIGGGVAGRARKDIEKQLQTPVATSKNYKKLSGGKLKEIKGRK